MKNKAALEGLFTTLRSRMKVRPLASLGTFDPVSDTEFYLFSPRGLVYWGWLLDYGLPPLDFDFEKGLRERLRYMGSYTRLIRGQQPHFPHSLTGF
jgi:hypothetical protein